MKIDSGVYEFTNKINGKKYIGQSKYLNARYREHKSALLSGTHHNPYFQKAFNKYGAGSFTYRVLKRCAVEELDHWEEHYILKFDTLDRGSGYNIREAGNNSGMPEEARERMSLSSRGKNNKLTPKEVEEIKVKRLQGNRCCELADEYGVKISTINKITMCKNWEYVRSDLNEELLNQSEKQGKTIAEEIVRLYEEGKRPHQIRTATGISPNVIQRVLQDALSAEKRKEGFVRHDFMLGKSVSDIMGTHSITYAQYKRITKGMMEERDKSLYSKITEMKQAGMMVKDIAVELNVNRCTINEICKRNRTS